ncbi:NADPH-dependent ferric siderophore reductase [Flavobacterium sediminis]|uniref:NADPH-dependent ferric siderophore reductase n=1 Tax=Flavobacterium sediminis TaxID=2201181 RepID=A0A2U8QRG3_9FLAO|nr:siderophore-interacting protein [Flavobacterium sediminis]AWM12748.1 NADPH-dependent ferric siderophore reductase [Flavobacterium sediminis]
MIRREMPAIMSGVLTLKEKKYVTPHYIRIVLTGDEIANFKDAKVGDNNKIAIPKSKDVVLNSGSLQQRESVKENFYIRTYTLRALDWEQGEMVVDFVAHGDEGPASSWAIHAEVGDKLGVMMKVKNKALFPEEANRYFLFGDHTAVPVVSVMLEKLPVEAKGEVFLEVFDESDILDLEAPKGIKVNWLLNSKPGQQSSLFTKLSQLNLAAKDFVFAACEHGFANQMQSHLREQEILERKDWQVYAYWKYGVSEDASSVDRKSIRA